MKISPISNNFYKQKTYSIKSNPQKNIVIDKNNNTLSNIYYPIAFSGGKSMNLAETTSQIDKFGEYPFGIRQSIQDILDSGNPNNLTLIDVHKDKYQLLSACETLEEAKEIYPEFKDVLSDSQVEFKPGSFLDNAKKGQVKAFDPDTDISLQLLQLYWGEGFSLTTLKNDYANQDIFYAFKKLNIPTSNPIYGQYLKLSDKNYNARYTQTISERAAEIERKRVEKKEGIYIPRGPLSEEHKAKISESLLKFYAQNPDRVNNLSERQLEFYRNNPEEYEVLSQVMLRAWSYREANPVKKKLSKALHKANLSEDDILNGLQPKHAMNRAFKDFWQKNTWAQSILSKCVTKSWERQRELMTQGMIYEPSFIIKTIPDIVKDRIAKYNRDEMPDISKYLDSIVLDMRDAERLNNSQFGYLANDKIKNAQRLAGRFFRENPDESGFMANVNSLALYMAMSKMSELYKSSHGKTCPMFPAIFNKYNQELSEAVAYTPRKIDANETASLYRTVINSCFDYNDQTSLRIVQESLNKAAEKLQNADKSKSYQILQQSHENLRNNLPDGLRLTTRLI